MNWARLVRTGLALVMMLSTTVGWASSLSENEILNKAAEQRTLAVSAAKHYVLSAANVDVKSSHQAMTKAMTQFKQNYGVMKFNAPNTYVRKSLKKLNHEWLAFSRLLDKKATNENVEAVVEAASKLVFLSDIIITNWHELSSDRGLESLNLAHQQAMLSERIGLLYAAHYYGLKADWVVMELSETLGEYESSLAYISKFMHQDADIKVSLEQVKNQWVYAKQGFAKFNQGHYLPKVIAVTVDSMQQQMVQVANFYAEAEATAGNAYNTLSVPGLAANIE